MLPLPRKDVLAIAAVLDIALHARGSPVQAKALVTRLKLSPRQLEPVLQALVHRRILKGCRGPHGGYRLAREKSLITADDILRAVSRADKFDGISASPLLRKVVMPALAEAQNAFVGALAHITLEELAKSAQRLAPIGGRY
jgi:Rrf2 family protein